MPNFRSGASARAVSQRVSISLKPIALTDDHEIAYPKSRLRAQTKAPRMGSFSLVLHVIETILCSRVLSRYPERMDRAFFATTNTRGKRIPFGIQYTDRFSHIYIIGKTGAGKTSLLESLLLQDIWNGYGVSLIDPHGDLVEHLNTQIPPHRADDVVYFDTADPNQPYGYNPLKYVSAEHRPLAASGLLEVLKKAWSDSWGQRIEHILRNAILALLDVPDAALPDILRLLIDKNYRHRVILSIDNERVRDFWMKEYEKYPPRTRAEAIIPIQNKIGAFLSDPILGRVLSRPDKPLSVRRIMDERKILLVNLAKGRFGEDSASLLGGLLVTTIGLAAFSRAEIPEADRVEHLLHVDEFQNFTTLSIANMVSELRKYRVGLVLANQYLHQLDPEIRYAILGNAGTFISFRVSAKDAAYIAQELAPTFSSPDLVHLPNYQIYLKLMIGGCPSVPFSAATLLPSAALSASAALKPANLRVW